MKSNHRQAVIRRVILGFSILPWIAVLPLITPGTWNSTETPITRILEAILYGYAAPTCVLRQLVHSPGNWTDFHVDLNDFRYLSLALLVLWGILFLTQKVKQHLSDSV